MNNLGLGDEFLPAVPDFYYKPNTNNLPRVLYNLNNRTSDEGEIKRTTPFRKKMSLSLSKESFSFGKLMFNKQCVNLLSVIQRNNLY